MSQENWPRLAPLLLLVPGTLVLGCAIAFGLSTTPPVQLDSINPERLILSSAALIVGAPLLWRWLDNAHAEATLRIQSNEAKTLAETLVRIETVQRGLDEKLSTLQEKLDELDSKLPMPPASGAPPVTPP